MQTVGEDSLLISTEDGGAGGGDGILLLPSKRLLQFVPRKAEISPASRSFESLASHPASAVKGEMGDDGGVGAGLVRERRRYRRGQRHRHRHRRHDRHHRRLVCAPAFVEMFLKS